MSSRCQIVLVDMDGTLADVGHRLHFINQAGRRKDWKRFFEGMDADTPIAEIADWVRELAQQYRIAIVTGRPEAYRKRTIKWLERFGVPWDEMHMRPDGDHRPDHVVKRQILDAFGPRRDLIAFVIDDRPSVCDMWRAAGLKCHQVGDPEEFRKSRYAAFAFASWISAGSQSGLLTMGCSRQLSRTCNISPCFRAA